MEHQILVKGQPLSAWMDTVKRELHPEKDHSVQTRHILEGFLELLYKINGHDDVRIE